MHFEFGNFPGYSMSAKSHAHMFSCMYCNFYIFAHSLPNAYDFLL